MKNIVFTVTNDLTYDQRMHRICKSLSLAGYSITLVGREKQESVPLKLLLYSQKRLKCFFEKGKFFYLEYNLRLFFYLLTCKAEIIGAVDLDTLVPCFIVSKLRNKTVVFDAHEHFTEMIELAQRPFTRWIWSAIEKFIVPKLQYAYTVSESLRKIFSAKFRLDFGLIRNVAEYESYDAMEKGIQYIIYAGAVNEGRGLHEMIKAMEYIPCKLYICGKGELYEDLLQQTKDLKLESRVIFFGYVPPEVLKGYIRNAFAGCLLLENRSQSYYFSLANKFFDYMHAGIPQITIDFPEYRFINDQFMVADLIPLEINRIVDSANKLLNDRAHYEVLACNAKKASHYFNWQRESEKLLSFYQAIE